jgi:hypothetical protein
MHGRELREPRVSAAASSIISFPGLGKKSAVELAFECLDGQLALPAGVEPTTYRLGGGSLNSIQLLD